MAVYVSDLFTATPAPVDANPTATRTFQWLRGSTAISGATSSTYTAVTADIGSSLSTTQFETNFLSSVTATSASTEVVQAFDPIRLFSSSEPGVWYDPNDAANLDWRRNLLLQTDQFESSTWTKLATTVTANAAAAPDGTMTADKIIASAASGEHGIYQTTSGTTGTVYVVAKAAEYTNLRMGELGNYWFYASFDLITGVVSGTGGPRFSSAYMVSLGDGWWQCVIKHTSVGTVPFTFGGFPTGATGFALANFTGNGTSGVFVAQSQAEQGTVATEYQPITDLNTEVIARFPNATLYQDTTGTAPVTTPGQTVALMLDKSRGSDLGPELVTNGDFTDPVTTGWLASGSAVLSVVSGRLRVANGATLTGGATYVFSTVAGRSYQWTYFADAATTGGVVVRARDNTTLTVLQTATITTSGSYSVIFVAQGSTTQIQGVNTGNTLGIYSELDNISVKELPGLHATQPTLASRPTYGIVPTGGRRNLLTQTEAFNEAIWDKTFGGVGIAPVVTANSGIDPIGGSTADRVQFSLNGGTTSSDISQLKQTVQTDSVSTYTLTFWAKSFNGASSYQMIAFGAAGAPQAIAITGEWTKFTVTNFGPNVNYSLTLRGGQTPVNSNTADILLWGAQLEKSATATAYQKVTTQYDVTEAGVPSLGYLYFDGVNDFMVTPTITPGIDKAQVFTGVRKLSDAAQGCIVEFSTGSGNGTFASWAPPFTNGGFAFWSRGTILASNAYTDTPSSPASTVLTGVGDISADLATLRLNGTQVAQATTDQGTGDYLAYQMYIGRRNGISYALNGHIHSLIVRFGPNLTTARIAATEAWVATKTAGVTL